MHVTLDKSFLAFNVVDQLVVINLVEWVLGQFLGTIFETRFKFVFIFLIDVLSLFEFSCDFQQLLDQFRCLNINFACSYFAADFEQLHDV